jgi:ectoine hydroxylase-related dioxygenase (phytanoyl-CoA dioxygenase family)
LGHYTPAHGTLSVLPGSHRLHGFSHPLGNQLKKPLLPGDYKRFLARKWHTSTVNPGDLVMFNVKTVHAATVNTTGCYRLSIDTRVVGAPFDPSIAHALAFPSPVKPVVKRKAPVCHRY